jgi:hypothetical protein
MAWWQLNAQQHYTIKYTILYVYGNDSEAFFACLQGKVLIFLAARRGTQKSTPLRGS